MRQLNLCLLGFLWCSSVFGGFSATDVFIPAIGQVEGVGGSHFDSTIFVTNPNAEAAQIRDQLSTACRRACSPEFHRHHRRVFFVETAAPETLFSVVTGTFGAGVHRFR